MSDAISVRGEIISNAVTHTATSDTMYEIVSGCLAMTSAVVKHAISASVRCIVIYFTQHLLSGNVPVVDVWRRSLSAM